MVEANNDSNVLIVGAGQLGSRYLQGLVNCTLNLNIYVYDVSDNSLKVSKERWEEVSKGSKHKVSFIKDFNEAPKIVDVCIVSTTANVRLEVMKSIVAVLKVKYWILEKVLGQSENTLNEILSIAQKSKGAWVNTPRRMLSWYKEIKKNLNLSSPLKVKVYGGAWGLACNSIHFIDYICSLRDEKIQSIDNSKLNTVWIESKRPGNWEAMGEINVLLSKGSAMSLNAQPGEVYFEIEIDDGKNKLLIKEEQGEALRSDGLMINGRIPYQSEMSGQLVQDLLIKGSVELPTAQESVEQHKVFINSLKNHWDKSGEFKSDLLPIT